MYTLLFQLATYFYVVPLKMFSKTHYPAPHHVKPPISPVLLGIVDCQGVEFPMVTNDFLLNSTWAVPVLPSACAVFSHNLNTTIRLDTTRILPTPNCFLLRAV